MIRLKPAALSLLLGVAAAPSALAQPVPEGGVEASDAAADRGVGPVGPAEAPRKFDDPVKDALRPRAGGLTAQVVAKRAVKKSPDVQLKRAELAAAAAVVDKAVAAFVPSAKLSATYLRRAVVRSDLGGGGALVGAENPGVLGVGTAAQCPAGNQCIVDGAGTPVTAVPLNIETLPDMWSLKANLSVPVSDYLFGILDGWRAANDNAESAELARKAAELQAAVNAQLAYYDWAKAKAALALSEKSLERVKARKKDADASFTLGQATKADVLQLEAQVASAEAAIIKTKVFVDVAEEQLAIYLGEGARRRRYRLGEDVLKELPATRSGRLADLIAKAQKARLEARSLRRAVRSLGYAASAARSQAYPRLDAFGEYDYSNPNPQVFPPQRRWVGTWQVGATLSWSVGGFLAGRAQGAELHAQKLQARAQLAKLGNGIRLQVTSAYLEEKQARASLAAARRGEKAASKAYEVATSLYKVGRATTASLLDAEANLVQASLNRVNALIELRVARAKLIHATGGDVRKTR